MKAFTKVGVDIGKNEIKCAIIESKAGLHNLLHCQSYPVPRDLSDKKFSAFLKSSIKDFLKISHIKMASLNFTVSCDSHNVISEIIDMPVVEEKLLAKSIKYELEEKAVLNQKEYTAKWGVMDKREEENEYIILSAMMRKEIIRILGGLNSISWKVDSIELQPVTIGRLIKNDAVVIDFGYSSTRVYMYKSGNPIGMGTIQIGGNYIIKKLLELYQNTITYEKAVELLHSLYVWSDNTLINDDIDDFEQLAIFITKEIKELTNEIKRVVRGLETKYNLFFEEYYYVGELSNLRYLPEFVSQDLDVEIKALELIGYDEEIDFDTNINKYTLAASVSLSTTAPYLKELNFVELRIVNFDTTSLLVGLLCASMALHIGIFDIHKKYDKNIEQVQTSVDELQPKIAQYDREIRSYRNNITVSQDTTFEVKDLKAQKKWLSDAFYAIPDITPTTVVLQKVNVRKGNIIINGVAKDYSGIGFFAIGLEKYGKVKIDTIYDTVDGDIYAIKDGEEIEDINKDAEKTNDSEVVDKKDEKRMNKTFQITMTYSKPRMDETNTNLPVDENAFTIREEEEIFSPYDENVAGESYEKIDNNENKPYEDIDDKDRGDREKEEKDKAERDRLDKEAQEAQEAKNKAEEERLKAEQDAKLKAEEDAKLKAEKEAIRKAEEERLKAEKEALDLINSPAIREWNEREDTKKIIIKKGD